MLEMKKLQSFNFYQMDRVKYQEILESIIIPDGMSQDDMMMALRPLNIALMQLIPERVYKYRSCSDNHISAFDAVMQPGTPEAMIRYIADGGKIAEPVTALINSTEIENMRAMAKEILSQGKVFAPTKEQMVNFLICRESIVRILPQIAQRFSSVLCFSEIIDSILMWSHYSYNHTGFALGYDLRSLLLPNDKNLGLFPVIYSDKRYNAEEFLLYLSGFLMHAPVHTADKMSSIKLLSYKSLDWQ